MRINRIIVIAFLLCATWIVSAMHAESVFRKRVDYAANVFPEMLRKKKVVPENASMLFIGNAFDVRMGRFLYLVSSNAQDETVWMDRGWFALKNPQPENSTLLRVLHSKNMDVRDDSRVFMRKDDNGYPLFEQTLILGPTYSILQITKW